MSIRDLAAQAADNRAKANDAAREQAAALRKHNALNACRTWFTTALGVTPDEIDIGSYHDHIYVRLDDIWVAWRFKPDGYWNTYHGTDNGPACLLVGEPKERGRREVFQSDRLIRSLADLGVALERRDKRKS